MSLSMILYSYISLSSDICGLILIIKALLLTFSILLIIGVILYLFPFIINLSTHEGQLAFKNEIDNLGVWGIIVLFMLQLLQIVLVVLPGEPLEILAGMCYGPIGGTIFIIVSVFITTTFHKSN